MADKSSTKNATRSPFQQVSKILQSEFFRGDWEFLHSLALSSVNIWCDWILCPTIFIYKVWWQMTSGNENLSILAMFHYKLGLKKTNFQYEGNIFVLMVTGLLKIFMIRFKVIEKWLISGNLLDSTECNRLKYLI